MKFIVLLKIVFFSLLSSCERNTDSDVRVIAITYDNGNRRGNVLIGINDNDLNKYYKRDNRLKEGIDMHDGSSNFQVSKLALLHLAEYIDKNCNKVEEEDKKAPAIFLIYLLSEYDTERCYYYSDKEIRTYFTNMVLWIENSKFKGEFVDILPQLRHYAKR